MQSQSTAISSWEKFHDDEPNILCETNSVFCQTTYYKSAFVEKTRIGEGGFGQVFHVQNKYDDEDYAVKKILLSGRLNIKRILRESKIWSKLKNPFILEYKSSWRENGDWTYDENDQCITKPNQDIFYIHMEKCIMTLREASNHINKELNQNYERGITLIGAYLATVLFGEILEGVNYLHTQSPPIIHRDLKLSNILITNEYSIKIGDFGIATIHNTDNNDDQEFNEQDIVETKIFDINYTHTHNIGTYEYMAEEVKSGKYDTSADMRSLGVILRKLICVKEDDVNNFEIINRNKQFNYYPINQIKLIRKLLQEWASKRPNCEQLLAVKHEWAVCFNDIKYTDNMREICYNYWNSCFKNDNRKDESSISNAMVVKKCSIEVLKSLQFKPTKEYSEMRNALNARLIQTESNITDYSKLFQYILLAFNICTDFPELCSFIENTLQEINFSKWYCFVRSKSPYTFLGNFINWFNNPYYIMSFVDEFNESMIHVLIVNIQNFNDKEIDLKEIKNTMDKDMSENSKQLSIKAINECNNIYDMQLYISNGLKQDFNDDVWQCYISKNELFTSHEIYPIPKHYFAFRLKEYCIIIVNEMLEIANYDMCIKYHEKSLSDIPIDERNAVEAAFAPQIINCSLILKQIELNGNKKCIVRICDSCSYSQQSCNNYNILIYDVQIFWINHNDYSEEIRIPCIDKELKYLYQKNKMTDKEGTEIIEKLSKDTVNESSSDAHVFNWLKLFHKLLSGNFNVPINNEILSSKFLDITIKYLNNDKVKLQYLSLYATNYYIRLIIKSDHHLITSKLIPVYVKLLESKDDNICFYALEGILSMIDRCSECHAKSLDSGLLTPLLQLLKPNKSLALIHLISKVINRIALPPDYLLPIDVMKHLMSFVYKLIDHTDSIVLFMLNIIRRMHNEYKEELDRDIIEKLIQLLIHDNQGVQKEAISVLADVVIELKEPNLLNGDFFDLSIYLKLGDILKGNNYDLKCSSIIILGRISITSESHAQHIIDAQLIPLLVDILKDHFEEFKKILSIQIIYQIFLASNQEQCFKVSSSVYSNNVINCLCKFISSDGYNLCSIIIFILCQLLISCEELRSLILSEIIECKGLVKIQQLIHHENEPLRNMVNGFIGFVNTIICQSKLIFNFKL